LGGVVHSWKSFTARQMNRQMGTSGKVWADDYFDRFIRNESHFASAVGYVENNPVKAGLVGRAADWAFSSAAAGDISPPCAQDARGPG
jgi:REP element-mobilizing transposase RayT